MAYRFIVKPMMLQKGAYYARNHEFLSNSREQWQGTGDERHVLRLSLKKSWIISKVWTTGFPRSKMWKMFTCLYAIWSIFIWKSLNHWPLSKGLFLLIAIQNAAFYHRYRWKCRRRQSTTARLARPKICWPPRLFLRRTVQLITTTDGFCIRTKSWKNAAAWIAKDFLSRKLCDMEALINFLECGRQENQTFRSPVYSHEVLQYYSWYVWNDQSTRYSGSWKASHPAPPANQQIYISDFLIFHLSWMPQPALIENGVWNDLNHY